MIRMGINGFFIEREQRIRKIGNTMEMGFRHSLMVQYHSDDFVFVFLVSLECEIRAAFPAPRNRQYLA